MAKGDELQPIDLDKLVSTVPPLDGDGEVVDLSTDVDLFAGLGGLDALLASTTAMDVDADDFLAKPLMLDMLPEEKTYPAGLDLASIDPADALSIVAMSDEALVSFMSQGSGVSFSSALAGAKNPTPLDDLMLPGIAGGDGEAAAMQVDPDTFNIEDFDLSVFGLDFGANPLDVVAKEVATSAEAEKYKAVSPSSDGDSGVQSGDASAGEVSGSDSATASGYERVLSNDKFIFKPHNAKANPGKAYICDLSALLRERKLTVKQLKNFCENHNRTLTMQSSGSAVPRQTYLSREGKDGYLYLSQAGYEILRDQQRIKPAMDGDETFQALLYQPAGSRLAAQLSAPLVTPTGLPGLREPSSPPRRLVVSSAKVDGRPSPLKTRRGTSCGIEFVVKRSQVAGVQNRQSKNARHSGGVKKAKHQAAVGKSLHQQGFFGRQALATLPPNSPTRRAGKDKSKVDLRVGAKR